MKYLSTKELNYVNDYLSWELLAAKKCYQYACQEANSPHQQILMDAARVHQNNYMNLLNFVEQFSKKQGGQMH